MKTTAKCVCLDSAVRLVLAGGHIRALERHLLSNEVSLTDLSDP